MMDTETLSQIGAQWQHIYRCPRLVAYACVKVSQSWYYSYPTTGGSLQSFLGFVTLRALTCSSFSSLATPLHVLLSGMWLLVLLTNVPQHFSNIGHSMLTMFKYALGGIDLNLMLRSEVPKAAVILSLLYAFSMSIVLMKLLAGELS